MKKIVILLGMVLFFGCSKGSGELKDNAGGAKIYKWRDPETKVTCYIASKLHGVGMDCFKDEDLER